MTIALGMLAATTLALAGASAWPRQGHPVLLLVPRGSEHAALGVEGWRLQRIDSAGPIGILVLSPEEAGAQPFRLARAAGALAVLAASPGSACASKPGRE